MKKITTPLISLIIVLFLALFTRGEVLELVAGYEPNDPNYAGYDPNTTFPDLQRAYHAANSGDEIVVHAGLYTNMFGGFSLYTAFDWDTNSEPAVNKQNILIQAAGDGPAIFPGVIGLSGTAAGVSNITIDGLYVNPDGVDNKAGFQLHPNGYYLGGCTIRNCVVYGSDVQRGIYLREDATGHGQHLIEHCTFYNSSGLGWKGLDDRTVGVKPAGMAPICRSNIAMGFDIGFYTWYGGAELSFTYSDGFGSTTANFSPASYKGTGSVEVYPRFYSLDPNSPYFLYLSDCTPDSVKTGAHDGTYMGALPVEPGTCPEFLLAVGQGYPFGNLQAAWNASQSGSEIIVHAGTYPRTSGDYCLNTDLGGSVDRDDVWIHAAGDGRVTFEGVISVFGTETGGIGNITFEGFYVNPEDCMNVTGFDLRASNGKHLGGCTLRDCVVYAPNLVQGIYLLTEGTGTQGQHLIEHCTVYGGGTGKGINEKIIGIKDANTAPIFRSNIIVGCDEGMYTWYGGFTFDYSDGYSNAEYDYLHARHVGPGSVSMDPGFISTDPNDPLFLVLGSDTPDAVMFGAHDDTSMGARLRDIGIYDPNGCGAWGYYQGDKNSDCYVDFEDFCAIAEDWMACTHPDCD
ncbi:MAG: hypothetical protein ABIG61_07930 [Planctomycetota bacterium]